MEVQGKKVTHKHGNIMLNDEGKNVLYFSNVYQKWMLSTFTPISKMIEVK